MRNTLRFIFSLNMLLTLGVKGFSSPSQKMNRDLILVASIKDSNWLKEASFFRSLYLPANFGKVIITEPGEIQRNTTTIKRIYRNLTAPAYLDFTLEKPDSRRKMSNSFLVEPGDSIYVTIDADSISKFSGSGSAKYNLLLKTPKIDVSLFQRKSDSTLYWITSLKSPLFNKDETYYSILKHNQKERYKVYQRRLQLVKQYEKNISLIAQRIIKSDFKYTYYQDCLSPVSDFLTSNDHPTEVQDYVRFVNECKTNFIVSETGIDYLSKERIDYAILDAKIQQWTQNGLAKEKFGLSTWEKTYQIIDQLYSGNLRDVIETKFLIRGYYGYESSKVYDLMKSLQERLQQPGLKGLLTTFINQMLPNAIAFDFALPDTSGNIVRLQDLRGKIILIDFWFTGCGACKIIAAEMKRAVVPAFADHNDLVYMTISVDKDVNKWKKSVRRGDYVKPGGIDLYTNGEGFNHPLVRHYGISGCPTFIIIGKDGRIISTNPPRPWTNDINHETTNFINYLRNVLKESGT